MGISRNKYVSITSAGRVAVSLGYVPAPDEGVSLLGLLATTSGKLLATTEDKRMGVA